MQGMLQLLRLINTLERIEGRKKLQKIVHILKTCGYEENFPQHFGYLQYGPFSSEVAAEIDQLVSGNLVNESGQGQPYEAYVYEPGESTPKLLTELQQDLTPAWASLAKMLNAKDTALLESISTILYIKGNGFSGEALKKRFSELKPTLASRFRTALSEAESLFDKAR